MATTSNYGWTTPDDSSLVKDGASAIRALGTAIDTSMNTALGTKKAGLVLLNTTSFSGVATQSFNNVFSSTYDNYLIVFNTLHSSDSGLTLRLRVGGADASTSAYEWQRIRGVSSTISTTAASSQTSFDIVVNSSGTSYELGALHLFDPAKASATYLSVFSNYVTNSASIGSIGGRHNVSTIYDGFTLIPTAGNITGAVSVYGYNK